MFIFDGVLVDGIVAVWCFSYSWHLCTLIFCYWRDCYNFYSSPIDDIIAMVFGVLETKHVTSSDYIVTQMPSASSLFITSSASYCTHLTWGRGGNMEHAKWFSELFGTYYS